MKIAHDNKSRLAIRFSYRRTQWQVSLSKWLNVRPTILQLAPLLTLAGELDG